MTVLDASVAVKWFIPGETGRDAAIDVLDQIRDNSAAYLVPEFFINEILSVLSRAQNASVKSVQQAMALLTSLGIARIANGAELIALATEFAVEWKISGYDAIYVALAALVEGKWLTADTKAASKISRRELIELL